MNNRYIYFIIIIAIIFSVNIFSDNYLRIKEINIFGINNIETEPIYSAIITSPGDVFSKDIISLEIKNLWATELIRDVEVKGEIKESGVILNYYIKEKFRYNGISVTGNDRFSDSKIEDEIDIEEGTLFDENTIKQKVNEVVKLYNEEGYILAKVNYEIGIPDEEDTIYKTLILEINEGPEIEIKEIRFNNNEKVSDEDLKDLMETEEEDNFDRTQFEKDIENIKLHYRNNGYINFKITDIKYDYVNDSQQLILSIDLFEGEQLRYGKITFEGNEVISNKQINEILDFQEGKIFSQETFDKKITELKIKYSERGYIFSEIEPVNDIEEESNVINSNILIREGEQAHVGKIIIRGNSFTEEYVIRREVLVKEGDIFNYLKVQQTRQKIFQLGFFSSVEIDYIQDDETGRMDLFIDVIEQKTGLLSLGLGYSSQDEFLATFEIAHNNIFGKAYRVSAKGEAGPRKLNGELGFTNPWLFGKPVSFGANVYNTKRIYEDYNKFSRGGSLRLGLRLGIFNNVYTKYKFENIRNDIKNEATTPDNLIDGNLSSITLDFVRNLTINPFYPAEGYKIIFSNEFAGGPLQGDIHFYKGTLDLNKYIKTFWKLVLAFHIKYAIIQPYFADKEVPDYEKFYEGGASSIRGYDWREININGDGGISSFVFNAEYRIPFNDNFQGALFYDAGNVYSDIQMPQPKDFYQSFGIGLRFITPAGPFRLDYGIPINDNGINLSGAQLHFTVGQMF